MSALAQSPALPCAAPDLISISTALADLLDRETSALSAMKVNEATALKDEKARLTRRYRAHLEELRAGRATLPAVASPARGQLTAVATRLADAAIDNERALRAGRAAVERVVAAIADAVALNQKRLAAYAPPRHAPSRPRPLAGVAIDRRL
jgi:hypothetical protein